MSTVDVSFEVRCECLPRDYGYALFRALAEELDWLEEDAAAGVHPLHGTTSTDGGLFLGKRARLILRVTAARAGQALSLTGSRLALGSGLEHELGPEKHEEPGRGEEGEDQPEHRVHRVLRQNHHEPRRHRRDGEEVEGEHHDTHASSPVLSPTSSKTACAISSAFVIAGKPPNMLI